MRNNRSNLRSRTSGVRRGKEIALPHSVELRTREAAGREGALGDPAAVPLFENLKMSEKLGRALILALLGSIMLVKALDLAGMVGPTAKYLHFAAEYGAVAILLWLFRKDLTAFHCDRGALILLAIMSVFRRRLGLDGEALALLIIGVSGLCILALLVTRRRDIAPTSWRWAGIGAWVGLMAMMLIALVSVGATPMVLGGFQTQMPWWLELLRRLVFNLSFAAPIEEILFRGLLWGSLKRMGWSDNRAGAAQALLFWLLHVNWSSDVLEFLLYVPVVTIVCTLLTKKSRQLFPAIIAHSIINMLSPAT